VIATLQKPDGYWCGDLLADTTLESDYILLQFCGFVLRTRTAGTRPRAFRIERAAQAILKRQHREGGYDLYPRGDADVSASVKAYTALKLAGNSSGE